MPLRVAGGLPQGFAERETLADEMVELLGWVLAEGHYQARGNSVIVSQSRSHNPEHCARLRDIQKHFSDQGATVSEYEYSDVSQFYFGKGVGALLRRLLPGKQLPMDVLCALTERQARLLLSSLDKGDGHQRAEGTRVWAQKDQGRVDAYQALCSMLGTQTRAREHGYSDCRYVTAYKQERVWAHMMSSSQEHYKGVVWCPRTPSMTWVARRNGVTYVTGNTYTELITEGYIEEYINDQLVDSRPNPLGTIPIACGPNVMVSGSPWGMSDVSDILVLNREYNEKATDVADIVNYHAAPVTIMTGAKSSQLERGAKKIWGGLPKDANVYNLELGGGGVAAGLSYLEMVKKAMHELTGVPEGALGDVQPISNTSGVALAIQYQPMMQRYNHKKMTYGKILKRINALALLTLAIKEPESLQYDPTMDEELQPYQKPFLDVNDPLSFVTVIHWPPPLPVDKTVVLNEIMLKMQIGIMSKKDALEELGEVFPGEKLRETFLELVQDAIDQGALDMLKSQISALVQD